MKCLFLDIDGVLNSDGYANIELIKGNQMDSLEGRIDPCNFRWLNLMLRNNEEDVDLIFTTNFRFTMIPYELKTSLGLHGLDSKVYVDFVDDHLAPKESLIRKYISDNGVGEYAVVDMKDMPLKNLVKTDYKVGLTYRQALQLMELLDLDATQFKRYIYND